MNRLNDPDFLLFINKYDILCMSETKLDSIDVSNIDVENFSFIPLNRGKYKRKSGGIGVFVRSTLLSEHLVKRVFPECTFAIWLLIDKCLLGSENDAICGSVYVEPESSTYTDSEIFDNIEQTLTQFEGSDVFLMGDFNARTGVLPDLPDLERNEDDLDPWEDDDPSSASICHNLSVPTQRHSEDPVVNRYGRLLLQLVKNNNLIILNGRVGEDRGIGRVTCKGSSVVDYCITSANLLDKFESFEVLEFNHMFSDIHNPIQASLKCANVETINVDIMHQSKVPDTVNFCRPKWSDDMIENFKTNLDMASINSLLDEVTGMLDKDSVSQENVDSVSNKLRSILIDSGKSCGAIKGESKRRSVKPRPRRKNGYKQWWDRNCETARKNFNNTKGKSKEERRVCSKVYKKAMHKARCKYRREFSKKIKNLKVTNPKVYWELLSKNVSNSSASMVNQISADTFAKHFKQLGELHQGNNDNIHPEVRSQDISSESLDSPFTTDEVMQSIKKLKRGKACGHDTILNEFLIYSSSKQEMVELYTIMFNLVLKSGTVPRDWVIGMIQPIYKKKGDEKDPNNYRGITLLSCVSKLFTHLLNERLKEFTENNALLFEEQIGFRAGHGTTDHIFTLNSIMQWYLHKKKRLYLAFVDYEKAFDSVNRTMMWNKLIDTGIGGKFLRVIQNLYENAKSCVKTSGLSELFDCRTGVRQGENLSPLLFAFFLNDLPQCLSRAFNGIGKFSEFINENLSEGELEIYLKLYVLLYADDTVIMAESPDELQSSLDRMSDYCVTNNLKVNSRKTKVMIVSRGKIRIIPEFFYNGQSLEIVSSFCYLGVTFNYNGRFRVCQQKLFEKANRAMFSLLSKARKLSLPLDTTIHLFNHTVQPVMLYGAEVWGPNDCGLADKLQLKFLKYLLKLKSSTTSLMVRGETGVYPMSLSIKQRVLNYWAKLNGLEDTGRICKTVFNCMMRVFNNNSFSLEWIRYVKSTLDSLGMSNIFVSTDVNLAWFKKAIKLRTLDIYQQEWSNAVSESSSCSNYRIYKKCMSYEPYLCDLTPVLRIYLMRFRTRNVQGIRNNEMCILCNSQCSDEWHYIFQCPVFSSDRKKLFTKIPFSPNIMIFEDLMNNKDLHVKLAKYVRIVVDTLQAAHNS